MAHAAVSSVSRAEHVAKAGRVFSLTMGAELSGREGIQRLEEFANKAEEVAHLKSRAMQKYLSEQGRDLTNHAAHMRTISAQIVLLRGGLVPALKIDQDSPGLREQAIAVMGFLWAEFQAMEALIE